MRHGPPRVAIGWRVSRACHVSGYWLAGRARARPRRRRGVIGCRAAEWLVRAPEGDVVWRSRRGVYPAASGAAGRPGLALDVRDRPAGSWAPKPESESAKRFGTCSQLGARRAVPRRLS